MIYEDIIDGLLKGESLPVNKGFAALELLRKNGSNITMQHSLRVADCVKNLAYRFGADTEKAFLAGLIHDVSSIIPNDKRLESARELDIDVLPEEEEFPILLHQKLSKYIAYDILKIEDKAILDAIECHTTLKADAGILNLILFTADKLEWDQEGLPPYLDDMTEKLKISLEDAAFSYIDYLITKDSGLKIVHPWLSEAYIWLGANKKD